MIHPDQYSPALRALQRLILYAKAQAYEAGEGRLGELLNDLELLPEFLADASDRTGDFLEMLHGLAQVHPGCRYIIEEFDQASAHELS